MTYIAAAVIAGLWVLAVMVPIAVYQATSPSNHLKRFPRQDQ